MNFRILSGCKRLSIRGDAGATGVIFILSQLWYVFHYHFQMQYAFDLGHYLNPVLLQQDLLVSLYYLHMQPPLANLIAGIFFKLPESLRYLFIPALHRLMAFAALICFIRALEIMEVSRAIRYGLLTLLCFNPTYNAVICWTYTTHLEFCLACIAMYLIARLEKDRQWTFRNGFALFFTCCLLGLLRPQWSLPMFVVLLALLYPFAKNIASFRAYTKGAACALSPLLLWMVKNLMLFGIFSASSWGGSNLATVVSQIITPHERKVLIQQGEVISESGEIPSGIDFNRALTIRDTLLKRGQFVPLPYKHPALADYQPDGRGNANSEALLVSGKIDLHDSVAIISHYPKRYLQAALKKMMFVIQLTTGEYFGIGFPSWLGFVSPFTVCTIMYGIIPLAIFLLAFVPGSVPARHRMTVFSTFFITAFMYIVSCAFNETEQNRMRWGQEPFYLLYLALLLESLWRLATSINIRFKKSIPEN